MGVFDGISEKEMPNLDTFVRFPALKAFSLYLFGLCRVPRLPLSLSLLEIL